MLHSQHEKPGICGEIMNHSRSRRKFLGVAAATGADTLLTSNASALTDNHNRAERTILKNETEDVAKVQ